MKPTREQLIQAARFDYLDTAERYLKRYGVLTFGIESVSVVDRKIRYVNLGDTYDETVISELGSKLSVGSWGSWVEGAENEYCEAEGVIRCGFCGEFTECAAEWRDTVCEHCGHLVGG